MSPRREPRTQQESAELPIMGELLAGVEIGFLCVSPVFLGFGIPHGDGSAVVLVPSFLGTDVNHLLLSNWLRRIGYRPCSSGIRFNADCPNLLIQRCLRSAIENAFETTGKKVHLIGHSLGGTMARAVGAQMPDLVGSVITLGSPIQYLAAHSAILQTVEVVRKRIIKKHGQSVLPGCYTPRCTCNFIESLMGKFPRGVRQTAIYSKQDGIMDWRACQTGDSSVDVEVSSTHVGLVFNPMVYKVVAERLAAL